MSKEQAKYRRLVHRIRHMDKMEHEKINFSPDILEVYKLLLGYVAMLDMEGSILREGQSK